MRVRNHRATVILGPRRPVDWTEPPAEGDHQLQAGEAGDND